MLLFLAIWIALAFALGVAFGKFAKEGMGTKSGFQEESRTQTEIHQIHDE